MDITRVLVVLLASVALAQSVCLPITSWSPSYPDPGDFSQHPQQSGEDNWIMCTLKDDNGNDVGVNSFQVRTDYASLIAAEWYETYILAGLSSTGALVAGALIQCGCTTDNCLATTATYLSTLPPVLAASPLLAHELGLAALGYAALYPSLPQEIGAATGVVYPLLNSTSHDSFENSTLMSNIDMTVFQVPGIPVRLNGPTFAYDENTDATKLADFHLLFMATAWSGRPISGALHLTDQYGPQLWGPNLNGVFNVPLPDGTVQVWTQTDQPFLKANGVINMFDSSVHVHGACWNSRQWSTHPLNSSPLEATGPYVWVPVVTKKFVAQFAVYYTDTTYTTTADISGNIFYPICQGDHAYDPHATNYKTEIDGKKCYAGPMQALSNNFEYILSNPWVSPHSGSTYYQTVRIISASLELDATAQALVADNEYDWKTAIGSVYSEAPCLFKGTYQGNHIAADFCSIEHLRTG